MILDDDVVVVAKVPGMVWEIKYRNGESAQIQAGKRSLISRILDLVR
jgi:hypothetical protein